MKRRCTCMCCYPPPPRKYTKIKYLSSSDESDNEASAKSNGKDQISNNKGDTEKKPIEVPKVDQKETTEKTKTAKKTLNL